MRKIQFNGGSWAVGALCAAIYFGHATPWWLLIVPAFVVYGGWINLSYRPGRVRDWDTVKEYRDMRF